MPGRSNSANGEPLQIELLDDDGDGDEEVSFGPRPGPRRPRLLVGLGVLAGLAVIVAAISLSNGDDRATPASTTPRPTTTLGTTTTTIARRASTTTLEPAPYVPVPAFATDPGWDVYLADVNSGPLYSFDPTTGVVERLPGERNVFAVYPSLNGPTFARWDQLGQVVYAPDGTKWVLAEGTLVDRGAGVNSEEIGQIILLDVSIDQNVQLIGTMENGDPVILLADQRAYVVIVDGTLRRLTAGATYQVTGGQYAENRCADNGVCSTLLHGTAGELELPTAIGYSSVAFRPPGRPPPCSPGSSARRATRHRR